MAELTGAAPAADLAAVRKRLEALAGELAAAEGRIRKRFPSYWSLINPEPVSVSELRGSAVLLHPDEALVQVFQDGQDILVFVVTHDGSAWAKGGMLGGELNTRVAKLRCDLDPQTCDKSGTDAQGRRVFDRQTAFKIYQAIFGDPQIAALLATKPKWLIAASGALTSLPLAVLVTAPPEGDDGDPLDLRDTHWLVRDRTLATLPNVAALRVLRVIAPATGHEAADPFLGFAPVFDGASGQPSRGATVARDSFRGAQPMIEKVRHLPVLSSGPEVEAMSRALGAAPDAVIRGAAASKAEVLALDAQGRLGRTRILAFATHGLLSGDFGLPEPALALTPPLASPAEHPERDDGLLTASDIAGLHLAADWVVLSACNTGAGDSPGAEGLSGLARAFFYAGARSLLVSHWRVRDDAARYLTTQAITLQSKDGALSRAQALRKAELALMDDGSLDGSSEPLSHPAAWAPFVLVGVE